MNIQIKFKDGSLKDIENIVGFDIENGFVKIYYGDYITNVLCAYNTDVVSHVINTSEVAERIKNEY